MVDDKIESARKKLDELENLMDEERYIEGRGVAVETSYELMEIVYLIEAEMDIRGDFKKIK